jgi:hypothetical protein
LRREALSGSLDAEQMQDLINRMEFAEWLRRKIWWSSEEGVDSHAVR